MAYEFRELTDPEAKLLADVGSEWGGGGTRWGCSSTEQVDIDR